MHRPPCTFFKAMYFYLSALSSVVFYILRLRNTSICLLRVLPQMHILMKTKKTRRKHESHSILRSFSLFSYYYHYYQAYCLFLIGQIFHQTQNIALFIQDLDINISCSVAIFMVILSDFNHKCFNILNILKLSTNILLPHSSMLKSNVVGIKFH